MSLRDIFCQSRAIAALQQAFLAGRLPTSYIFAGPEGVGKFTTARAFAKLLLCHQPAIEKKHPPFADSCQICPSCQAFEQQSHPAYHLIYKELREFTRDGKGKGPPVELQIDVIREFLTEKIAVMPTLSARKVFLVCEAEKLNISSQNSLLKVLEEPPTYCCIILLCTRLERLLPTIKSRCQIVPFGPIDRQVIAGRLQNLGLDNKKSQVLARLAAGSIGIASQWTQLIFAGANLFEIREQIVTRLSTYTYEQAVDLAASLLDQSKTLADAWADLDKTTSKSDLSRRAMKFLVRLITSVFSDAMILPFLGPENIANFDRSAQIETIARRFSPAQAAEKILDCQQAQQWIEENVNEKLIFERLLLKIGVFDNISV